MIDVAMRYMCGEPKADYENLPDIMVWYYYTNKIRDNESNYSDSLSMQAAVITAFLLDNGWDINATGTKERTPMSFAELLKQCRKQQGMSQAELASKLGVTQQAVGKWESGKSSPDPSTVARIA